MLLLCWNFRYTFITARSLFHLTSRLSLEIFKIKTSYKFSFLWLTDGWCWWVMFDMADSRKMAFQKFVSALNRWVFKQVSGSDFPTNRIYLENSTRYAGFFLRNNYLPFTFPFWTLWIPTSLPNMAELFRKIKMLCCIGRKTPSNHLYNEVSILFFKFKTGM